MKEHLRHLGAYLKMMLKIDQAKERLKLLIEQIRTREYQRIDECLQEGFSKDDCKDIIKLSLDGVVHAINNVDIWIK